MNYYTGYLQHYNKTINDETKRARDIFNDHRSCGATQVIRNQERCIYYCHHGDYSRARNALSSNGLAPLDRQTMDKLHRLFPDGPQWEILPGDYERCSELVVEEKLVMECITAAGGPDLITPHYFQIFAKSDGRVAFISELTKFAETAVNGKLVLPVRPYYASGNVFASYKDKTAGPVRPLKAGLVIRRLTSKIMVKMMSAATRAALFPLNVGGVCISGGIEAVIHCARTEISILGEKRGYGALKVDIMNAYNELDRLYKVVNYKPYYDTMYHQHSYLYTGIDELMMMSRQGLDQGDGCSSDCYPIAINYMIEMDTVLYQESLLQLWYYVMMTLIVPNL